MLQYKLKYKVTWGDTDAAGIVYFPNFYRWMNDATIELFNSIGFPFNQLFKENIGLPAVETHCEFKSPVFFEDNIEIITTVTEVRNKIIRFSYEMNRDDALLATGYAIRAWTTSEDGKLKAIEIPDEIRMSLLG